MSDLQLSFFGDDFTGSTDAMESLARAGIRTELFTSPPSPSQLARYPGLRAFGVAGMTRAMPPDEMERVLDPALRLMRESGAAIIHYKVCSTFDSSPTIGSIGRAIDVGATVFQNPPIPVIPAAPALGRYCIFGNLFARCGTESEPFRIDRHPSMSRHPVTPMDESDLRRHLARQTGKSIGLIDVLALEGNVDLTAIKDDVALIDLLYDHHLAKIGAMLDERASRQRPLFVVGSSGVEAALAAHWGFDRAAFPPVAPSKPILVVSGSRSPVTAQQIETAQAAGFVAVAIDSADSAREAITSLKRGCSTIVHAPRPVDSTTLGDALGHIARWILDVVPLRRMIVAGGDTSGAVAGALQIESLEMIGELTRGSPLCRAAAPPASPASPASPADGIEITFKGGQIGPADFFIRVEQGVSHA